MCVCVCVCDLSLEASKLQHHWQGLWWQRPRIVRLISAESLFVVPSFEGPNRTASANGLQERASPLIPEFLTVQAKACGEKQQNGSKDGELLR